MSDFKSRGETPGVRAMLVSLSFATKTWIHSEGKSGESSPSSLSNRGCFFFAAQSRSLIVFSVLEQKLKAWMVTAAGRSVGL